VAGGDSSSQPSPRQQPRKRRPEKIIFQPKAVAAKAGQAPAASGGAVAPAPAVRRAAVGGRGAGPGGALLSRELAAAVGLAQASPATPAGGLVLLFNCVGRMRCVSVHSC